LGPSSTRPRGTHLVTSPNTMSRPRPSSPNSVARSWEIKPA
jgi:hypothetical protein